jgi:hypothetical protein
MFPFPWSENGLPQLSPDDIPTCGGSDLQQEPCTREGMSLDILERIKKLEKLIFNRVFSGFHTSPSSISTSIYTDILEHGVSHSKLCLGDNSKREL